MSRRVMSSSATSSHARKSCHLTVCAVRYNNNNNSYITQNQQYQHDKKARMKQTNKKQTKKGVYICHINYMSPHAMPRQVYVSSCHVTSQYVSHDMSRHAMPHHVFLSYVYAMPNHVFLGHVTPCHITSFHVTSRHVTWRRSMSSQVTLQYQIFFFFFFYPFHRNAFVVVPKITGRCCFLWL